MERKSRADRAIEGIDRGLQDAAGVTIESSLKDAVEAGRMSQAEADDCLRAYMRTLGGLPVRESLDQ